MQAFITQPSNNSPQQKKTSKLQQSSKSPLRKSKKKGKSALLKTEQRAIHRSKNQQQESSEKRLKPAKINIRASGNDISNYYYADGDQMIAPYQQQIPVRKLSPNSERLIQSNLNQYQNQIQQQYYGGDRNDARQLGQYRQANTYLTPSAPISNKYINSQQ